VRHVSEADTGWLAAIPQLAGFVGGCLGGLVSDGLARRGMEPVRARKLPTVAGLVAAGLFATLAPLPATTGTSLALFSAAMFFGYGSGSCSWTLGASLTAPRYVATMESIQNIGGSLGGALAPYVTGVVVERTHGFGPAFLIGAIAAFGSALSYALVRPNAYAGLGAGA
jgi:MFS family permease